jgi:hypothetical protein
MADRPLETPYTDFSERTCQHKRRFPSREDCELSIADQMRRNARTPLLRAYFCRWCSQWHKAKRSVGVVRERD